MQQEYVHLPLGEDVHFLSGYYTPLREFTLNHNGREVLCVIGSAAVEAGCCGNRCGAYAIVPGYVVAWQNKRNEAGLPVSEVDSITDQVAKREITATIKENECIFNIDFW